jgi:hypothetical protein
MEEAAKADALAQAEKAKKVDSPVESLQKQPTFNQENAS